MYLNKIFQTFINPKGKITASSYLTGISLVILYHFLTNIFLFRSDFASFFIDSPLTRFSTGIVGLINISDDSTTKIYGMSLFNIKQSLMFLTAYIAFIVTFKRCVTLNYKKIKCYVLSILTCLFFAMIFEISDLILFILGFPLHVFHNFYYLYYLILPVVGCFIVYLTDKSAFKSNPTATKLLLICFVFAILKFISINKIYQIALYLSFFSVFIHHISSLNSIYKRNKIYMIFFLFIAINCIITYIFMKSDFNVYFYFFSDSILEFVDIVVLLFGLFLILLSTIDDQEQDALNEKEVSWRSNSIIDLLFNFKGNISGREYIAMLILIFIGINAYFTPDFLRIPNSIELFPFLRGYYHPVKCFYIFLMVYSSIVISLKRARTKSQPIAWGWITGIFTYLMFWCWQKLITFSRYDQQIYTNDKTSLFYISVFIIGIILVVSLSIKSNNDEKTDIKDNYHFTGIDYLITYFIIAIFMIIATVLFPSTISNYHSSSMLQLMIWIAFLGLLIYYSIQRIKDAKRSIGWIFAAYILLIGLVIVYLFTRLYFIIYIIQYIVFLRFVLVALPSKLNAKEKIKTRPNDHDLWL
jgi:hypothetical protein